MTALDRDDELGADEPGARSVTTRADESQRAMVAAKVATLTDGQHKRGAQTCAPSQPDAAKALGVSRRSVQSAREVVTKGTPELVEAVERGQVSVSAAAVDASAEEECVALAVEFLMRPTRRVRRDGARRSVTADELLQEIEPKHTGRPSKNRGDASHISRASAIRRAGELLQEIQPSKGGRPGNTREGGRPSLRSSASGAAGLSPHQTKQALRVAAVTEKGGGR
jgi:hypothetical protein